MTLIQSQKKQEYTYSFKTAVFTSNYINLCTDKILFWLVPPKNSLGIHYLHTQLKFQFESSIPSAVRYIKDIGIIGRYGQDTSLAEHFRILEINKVADANREVELSINLSSLLKKDDIASTENIVSPPVLTDGFTFVYVSFDSSLVDELSLGRIRLWKTDALFTTTGIR